MNAELTTVASSGALNDDNPWPGLLPFGEADGKYFQGRDFEAEMLYRRLDRARLTTLFAPSGLGKSSILRAGLFPLVRKDNVLPVYIRLDFSQPKPDLVGQVKNAVQREAERARVEAPRATPRETLWEYFHRKDAEFWSDRHQLMRPLLVFDQFEEVFTLGARDLPRAHQTNTFLTELADLVEGRPPLQLRSRLELERADKSESEALRYTFDQHRYKVVLSLREDFLPDLEGLAENMGSIAHNRFRLGRMNGVAALQVVNQAPQIVAPDVGEKIVRFVAASEGDEALVDLEVEPALLSVVCNELNRKRQELGDARITERTLEGSQKQVLADFYERSIADFSEPVRTFVEEKLLTRHGFRNLVVYEEALSAPDVSESDIEQLIAKRLVRIEERGRLRLVELTHDLLIGVVTASRDERRRRESELEAVRSVEERLRLSRKRAAATILVLLLGFVAFGGLAWAVLAQRQAAELTAAKEEAEQAAREASRQRQIAETRRLEAERMQLDAERARELAVSAAVEASRQQQIADDQREEALRQRLEAELARAEAETAADDALVQKSLAEEQRTIVEQSQLEILENQEQIQATNEALVLALEERLSGPDADDVVGALDILSGSRPDTEAVMARVAARWFESPRELSPLLVSLEALAEAQPERNWAQLRSLLLQRLSENTPYRPPPAAPRIDAVPLPGGTIRLPPLPGATESGSRLVRVAPYALQTHEVTVGDYRRFDPGYASGAPADHPVTNVSWHEAMAYAAWLGGSLPTEAQWQLAARGPEGRRFPWGDTPPSPRHANYSPDRNARASSAPAPVGSFVEGATPEGLLDMAGNVWEWCRDGNESLRTIKGGSFFNDATFLEPTGRNTLHPEASESIVGFRVAWARPGGSR